MHKKVLIFIPEFPTITETFIAREVEGLIDSPELDVTVLAKKSGVGSISKKVREKCVYRSVKIKDSIASLRFLFSNFTQIKEIVKIEGFKNWYELAVGMSYAQIFDSYKPDFILAHFMSVHSTYAMIAAKILGIDFGISAHARDITEYPDQISQKVESAKFVAICNKNAYKKVLEEAGFVNMDSVHLIYHGYNPKILKLEGQPQKQSPPLILLIGRNVEKKGIEYAIQASKILKDKKFDHKMVIVGGGPLSDTLKSMIKKYGLEEFVDLLGYQPHSKVVELMHKASVYIQPSIVAKSGDVDGIPNGLIEASLLEVPSVTTNAGSISDLLTPENAMIVEQRNPEQLSAAIESLIQDEEKSKKLALRAYEKALDMFSDEESIKKLVALITK